MFKTVRDRGSAGAAHAAIRTTTTTTLKKVSEVREPAREAQALVSDGVASGMLLLDRLLCTHGKAGA